MSEGHDEDEEETAEGSEKALGRKLSTEYMLDAVEEYKKALDVFDRTEKLKDSKINKIFVTD